MEERSVLTQRYEIGRQLGQGTFAKVYYARNLANGQSVAIKILDKDKILKVGLVDQIKREISIMRIVRHPNVLQLFEVMATRSKIYFVLEYAKGGELFNKLAKGKLSEEGARTYFHQLISAIDYCHSRGVYHRDLKPENLLVDEYGTLRVSDFGLSALTKNLMELYRKIAKAEYRCPRYFSTELKELLSGILDPDPNTRMSIARIKRSPWYRKPVERTPLRKDKTYASEAAASGLPCRKSSDGPASMNAFNIISLTPGFDLSGLFDERYSQREARFASNEPPAAVFVKLEELAQRMKLKVTKKDNGAMKLAAPREGKKGTLEFEAEIYELASSFLLVELKKTNGDTMEYQKLLKEDIRPSLKDIVWSWHGDVQQQAQLPQDPQWPPPQQAQQPQDRQWPPPLPPQRLEHLAANAPPPQ
ncbi:CBL-interacting protein kinase 28 [Triticum urartu]|uniref:non-specific serine/threonine protein kinase n=1 Tax=Triticum urartu TaxID=4572 RepID=M7ZHB8_TRIUA|nr:CBL-interacting protein kinase 28 [Triticum urartu]